jgi:hypothetical protein
MLGAMNILADGGMFQGVLPKYGRIKQTWSSDCHRNELKNLL